MAAPPMFRRKALQRISSPEQLDRMVRVASPARWIALAALLAAVAAVLVWAFVATVPTTVRAAGYFLPEGGLQQLTAPVSGTVGDLSLKLGEHVSKGEKLATVSSVQGGTLTLRSPFAGIVAEVDVRDGSYVDQGNGVAQVLPDSSHMVVYAYVPTEQAAGLPPGTVAHVSFGSGVGATYGYAKGSVESASPFPATDTHLRTVLQIPSVVAQIEALGPVGEVVVSMTGSSRTKSGLAWGSGGGPPAALPAGLSASVTFVIGSHHPIDNVL